jgi:DNA-binding CsgD family transcriptional regulator
MPWRTRIIGRGPETAELDAQWQRAAAGEFRFVLVVGEPGMGKTRLAAEALEDRRRASIELSARAHPLGDTASFGLWVEALERHLRTLGKQEVARLCGGFLDDLASLLRSVAVVRGTAPDREPPRPRLLEGLAVLLANLAEQAPVVVVLDDVHLADASSWDALHYLAGSLSTERILVVASARPGELADHPVAQRVLLDLEQIGALRRVEIGPLPAEAVRELTEEVIGTAAEPELLDWLGSRAQGNPLFVLGLLQALVEEGGDLARPALRSLPEGLAERVRVRMRRLDDRQREIIDILAVAGGRVELGDVVVLCDRPLEELGPALQDLVRSRFVAEARRGRTFSYEISHPLVQETVYEGIVGARRVVLHRQVGRVLLTMGRLGEAAPHFARSAEVGDPEALAVLSDALHQAEERGAYGEGLRILSALVELLPAGDRRWVEVANAFSGRAEWVFDHRADADFAAAIDALRAIEAHLEGSGDLLQRASIKSRLTSFLAWGTGELDRAAETAAEALDLFTRAGDRSGRLLAALEVAYVKGLAGDLPALEAGCREVAEAAAEAGDGAVAARAKGVLGTVLFYQGRFAEAEETLRRSVAEAKADGSPYRITWNLMSLGWSLGMEGRLDEALQCFADAKEANPAWREGNVLELESHVRWLAGDLAGSLRCTQESVTISPGMSSRRRGMGMVIAALATVEIGEIEETRRHVASVRRVYGDSQWYMATDLARHASALLARAEGQLDIAGELLARAVDGVLAMGAMAFAPPILLDLAEVALAGGQPAEATQAVEQLERLAKEIDRDLYRAVAAVGRALLRLETGDSDGAVEPARAAVALLEGSGYDVLLGRALDVLGRAAGDRMEAVEALERAVSAFDRCQAVPRRDRTVEALRGLGASGRRAAAAAMGPASLTARELEVARLAALRLTAAEIAHELFISRRTVEGHLANVYAKLGVHSKREFSQRAATLGLVDRGARNRPSANP